MFISQSKVTDHQTRKLPDFQISTEYSNSASKGCLKAIYKKREKNLQLRNQGEVVTLVVTHAW